MIFYMGLLNIISRTGAPVFVYKTWNGKRVVSSTYEQLPRPADSHESVKPVQHPVGPVGEINFFKAFWL